MPWAVPRPCTTPGCRHMQPCPTHARRQRPRYRDTRPNSYQRGYGGAAWTKTRMHVLHRDRVCAFCGEEVWADGKPLKGATVHHIIPKADGGSDDESNLTACHKRCHDHHHGRA